MLLGQPGQLRLAARVVEPTSGRSMGVHTTAPGVQLYSGNFLAGSLTGKGEAVYKKHAGFCLETQAYPDAINKRVAWTGPRSSYGQATFIATRLFSAFGTE